MPPRRGINDLSRKAEPHLHKIEGLHEDIKSLKGEFMAKCKAKRKLMRECYKAGKDDGVPAPVLKGIVEQRKLQRKIDKIPTDFDMDEAAAYRELARAFGPLGTAAAVRAGYGAANGGAQRTPTAVEAKAAQQTRDHEAGVQTVGRGPVSPS